ncbi:MAG: sigma-70 family RNA polymerase sigma factor [Phycisphaerae bacterium]|nr:sigma-70 family RNA polymerase sigma factor [Phycisphaerae bacterium]
MADVIRRAQGRDPAAFEALVDAYSHRLYGFIYRLTGNRDDADDLLQEVFVRVVRMIVKYQDDGRFEAWLFRIAMNLARDRVRRIRKSPIVSIQEYGPPDEGDRAPGILDRTPGHERGPPETLELADQVDRLQWALDQLGQAEREVIMLRHFSGLPFNQIAELMGTPLGTALARAHRGLRRLRLIMEEAPDRRDEGDRPQ